MLGEYLMGPLKRYLTQTLASSLSKYISNINIETLGVGGDMILRDLELRLDVLQESLKIPLAFEFSRGFIKELRIQIHWTKLLSHPIHVKISTIEIILTARSELQFRKLKLAYQNRHGSVSSGGSLAGEDSESIGGQGSATSTSVPENHSADNPSTTGDDPQDDSQKGGWLNDALRKIVANATIEISDLVLKYEHANVVLSASFRSLSIFSADPRNGWKVKFQEPQGTYKSIFKACEVKDLTINLERIAFHAPTTSTNEGDNNDPPTPLAPSKGGTRRRSLSSGTSSSVKTSPSKRHSLRGGARAKPATVELPILRRACMSFRAKLSIDPFASRERHVASENHHQQQDSRRGDTTTHLPKSKSSGELFMQSAMQLIKRSTSETFADYNNDHYAQSTKEREPLYTDRDPYRNATCLLPLLCDVDSESWRARKQTTFYSSYQSSDHIIDEEEDLEEMLDWAVLAISDIEIACLDVFISEEQVVMLGRLMALPDNEEEDSDESSEDHQDSEDEESLPAQDTLQQQATLEEEQSHDEQESVEDEQAASEDRFDTLPAQEGDGEEGGQAQETSWSSWAWGVVVGDNDEALDAIESEMLTNAEESRKEVEKQKALAIHLARKRKRFITVCGMRVDRAQITFLLHRKDAPDILSATPPKPVQKSVSSMSSPVIAVPVANLGVIEVEMEPTSPAPSNTATSTNAYLREVGKIEFSGIVFEGRVVDDLSPNRSLSFVEVSLDVELIRISRKSADAEKDVLLWGTSKRPTGTSAAIDSLMETMPHPLPCWSFFCKADQSVLDSFPIHSSKECCLGTTLYRRKDKMIRTRIYLPRKRKDPSPLSARATVAPMEIDAAFGPLTFRIDPVTVEIVSEFLEFQRVSSSRVSSLDLRHLDQGTRTGQFSVSEVPLDELLAMEYDKLMQEEREAQRRKQKREKNLLVLLEQQGLERVQKEIKPIDIVVTCPAVQLITTTSRSPPSLLAVPATRDGPLSLLLSTVTLRLGVNLHQAHPEHQQQQRNALHYVKSQHASGRHKTVECSVGEIVLQNDSQDILNSTGLEMSMVSLSDKPKKQGSAFPMKVERRISGGVHMDQLVLTLSNHSILSGMDKALEVFRSLQFFVNPSLTTTPTTGTSDGSELILKLHNFQLSSLLDTYENEEVFKTSVRLLNMCVLSASQVVFKFSDASEVTFGLGIANQQNRIDGCTVEVVVSGPPVHCVSHFLFGKPPDLDLDLDLDLELEQLPSASSVATGDIFVGPFFLDCVFLPSVLECCQSIRAKVNGKLRELRPQADEPKGDIELGSDGDDPQIPLEVGETLVVDNRRTLAVSEFVSLLPDTTLSLRVNIQPSEVILSGVLRLNLPEIVVKSVEDDKQLEWYMRGTYLYACLHGARKGLQVRPIIDRFDLHGKIICEFSSIENPISVPSRAICAHVAVSLSSSDLTMYIDHNTLYSLLSAVDILKTRTASATTIPKSKARKSTTGSAEAICSWRLEASLHVPKVHLQVDPLVGSEAINYKDKPRGLSKLEVFRCPDTVEFSFEGINLSTMIDQDSLFDEHSIELCNALVVELWKADVITQSDWRRNTLISLGSNETLANVLSFLTLSDVGSFASSCNISLYPSLSQQTNLRTVKPIRRVMQQLRYRHCWSGGTPTSIKTLPVFCCAAEPSPLFFMKMVRSSGDTALQAKMKPMDMVVRPAVLSSLRMLLLSCTTERPRKATPARATTLNHSPPSRVPHMDFAVGSMRLFVPVSGVFAFDQSDEKELVQFPNNDDVINRNTGFLFTVGGASCHAIETGGNELVIKPLHFSMCKVLPFTLLQRQRYNDDKVVSLSGSLMSFFASAPNNVSSRLYLLEDAIFLSSKTSSFLIQITQNKLQDEQKIHFKVRPVLARDVERPFVFLLNNTHCRMLRQLQVEFSTLFNDHFTLFWYGSQHMSLAEALYCREFQEQVMKKLVGVVRTEEGTKQRSSQDQRKLKVDLELSKGIQIVLAKNDGDRVVDFVTNSIKLISEHSTTLSHGAVTVSGVSLSINDNVVTDRLDSLLVNWNGSNLTVDTTNPSMSVYVQPATVSCLLEYLQLCEQNGEAEEKYASVKALRDFEALKEKAEIHRNVLKAVVKTRKELDPFEEITSLEKISVGVKIVLPSLAVQLADSVLVSSDQLFVQVLRRGRERVEFDVVAVGVKLERRHCERKFCIVYPTDVRLYGVQHIGIESQFKRVAFTLEATDCLSSFSKEHLSALLALANAFTFPSATTLSSTTERRKARIMFYCKKFEDYTRRISSSDRCSSRGDFDLLKRIYDLGENLVPGSGQIVFGAIGTLCPIIGNDYALAPHKPTQSVVDMSLETNGQLYMKTEPLSQIQASSWVTLQWEYFEPRILSSIDLIQPLPIPYEVASVALPLRRRSRRQRGNTSSSTMEAADQDNEDEFFLECQLCLHDDLNKCFVVVCSFDVPLEADIFGKRLREDEEREKGRTSVAVDEFANAFNDLVEQSVHSQDTQSPINNKSYRRVEENYGDDCSKVCFPIDVSSIPNVEAGRRWMIRWKACSPSSVHEIPLDDRLAVCTALSRSLHVGSICSTGYWYPFEFNVKVSNLRIAILHASNEELRQGEEGEELFILRVEDFETHVEQDFLAARRRLQELEDSVERVDGFVRRKSDQRVRVSTSTLDVSVQDFGFLTITPFVSCYNLQFLLASNLKKRVDLRNKKRGEDICLTIDCSAMNWNMSRKTLLPFHYGVQTFMLDLESVFHAKQDHQVVGVVKTKEEDDIEEEKSLQYLLVNSTGRKIWFGQYGTAEVLSIDNGETTSYSWRVSEPYLRPLKKDYLLQEEMLVLSKGISRESLAGKREQMEKQRKQVYKHLQNFEPLMRFALGSTRKDRYDSEPGTWSRPLRIDSLGVHKRVLVYGTVNKDIDSVFFGNEPCTNLWISTQRGENGLQTIVRMLPSHLIVNRIPQPLQVQMSFLKQEADPSEYALPEAKPMSLKRSMLASLSATSFTVTTTDSSDESIESQPLNVEQKEDAEQGDEDEADGSDGEEQGKETVYGFMDENAFVYDYPACGTLGLMCPDAKLSTSYVERDSDLTTDDLERIWSRKSGKVCIRFRRRDKNCAADWSDPVVLEDEEERSTSLSRQTKAQLLRIPGVGCAYFSLGFASVYSDTSSTTKKKRWKDSWCVVELFATGYLINNSPWVITCGLRPQNRLELLQYALLKKEQSPKQSQQTTEEESEELLRRQSLSSWPVVENKLLMLDEQRTRQPAPLQPHASSATLFDVEAASSGPLNRTLSASIEGEVVNQQQHQQLNHTPGEVWSVAPDSVHPIHTNPAEQGVLSIVLESNMCNPLLRMQEDLFLCANHSSSRRATLREVENDLIASRTMQFIRRDDRENERFVIEREGIIEAHVVSNSPSLILHFFTSVHVVNETDYELNLKAKFSGSFQEGTSIVNVKPLERRQVGWQRERLLGMCVAVCLPDRHAPSVWSSMVSLNQPDEHIVAIPLSDKADGANSDGWVAQFLCEVNYHPAHKATTIVFKNRIVVFNKTGLDLVLRVESPFLNSANHGERKLEPMDFPKDIALTPLSFFCNNPLRQKRHGGSNGDEQTAMTADGDSPKLKVRALSDFSDWFLNRSGSAATAKSDADDRTELRVDDFKLLCTVARLASNEGSTCWSEELVIPSLNVPESFIQMFLLETKPGQIETILLQGSEVNGIVQVVVQRETQPDSIITNHLPIPILLSVKEGEKKTSGWSTAAPDTPPQRNALYIPPSTCIAVCWNVLLDRCRGPPFEVLGTSSAGRDDGEGDSVEDEEVSLNNIHASLIAHGAFVQNSFCVLKGGVQSGIDRSGNSSKVFDEAAGRGDGLKRRRRNESGSSNNGTTAGEENRMLDRFMFVIAFAQNEESPTIGYITTYSEKKRFSKPLWKIEGVQECTLLNDISEDVVAGEEAETPVHVSVRREFASWTINFGSAYRAAGAKEQEERTFSLLFHIPDLQMSLFDDYLETINLRVREFEVGFTSRKIKYEERRVDEMGVENSCTIRGQGLRLDSYVHESDAPVVLYFLQEEETPSDSDSPSKGKAPHRYDSPTAERARIVDEDKLLLGLSWLDSASLPRQYGKAVVHVSPIAVAVEDALVERLAESIAPMLITLIAQQRRFAQRRKTTPISRGEVHVFNKSGEFSSKFSSGRGLVCLQAPAQLLTPDTRLFIRRLKISDLHIVCTLRTTSKLPMFVGFDRTPLSFSAVNLGNVFEEVGELRKELLANYIADAILVSPALLGSLELLGNPAGFIRSIGNGVYDLLFLPLNAIRHGYGPGAVLRSVAHGWTSLIVHLSEGALMSVSGFSTSVARNLDRLSMDPAYAMQREEMRRRRTQSRTPVDPSGKRMMMMLDERRDTSQQTPQEATFYYGMEEDEEEVRRRFGTAKGIARGFLGLSQGVVGAATGIVRKPLESGKEGDWAVSSVLKGVGKGLVGVVTKPIGGAADFVAQTSGGIMQEAGIGSASGPQINRKRRVLLSIPHPALRMNWKVFHNETYVYSDRVALVVEAGQVAEVVITDQQCWLMSVFAGSLPCDISVLQRFPWKAVVKLQEDFADVKLLTIHYGEERSVSFRFVSKAERRTFVKIALAFQRRARLVLTK